jgi:hypothetical protein
MTVGFGYVMVQAGDDIPLAGRVLRLQHNSHRSIRSQSIIPRPRQATENPPAIYAGGQSFASIPGGILLKLN